MSKLLLVLLLSMFFVKDAFAFQCNVIGGRKLLTHDKVDVALRSYPSENGGSNYVAPLGGVRCDNGLQQTYIDRVSVPPGGLHFPLALGGGASYAIEINGTRYSSINKQVPLFELVDSGMHALPIDLIVKMNATSLSGLAFKAGQVIAVLDIEKCSIRRSAGTNICENVERYKWEIRSATDVYIKNNTCDVNNGQAINVDFGRLDKTKLRDNPFSARPTIKKMITITCKKAGGGLVNFSGPAAVQLRAVASSFNVSLIQTELAGSTNMMATVLLDGDEIIGPYHKMDVQLKNGSGNKNISFAVVKNPAITYSQISDGRFVANAVLVVESP
jgi:hypothetical protein